jgi:hypothetical protein
VIGVNRIFCCDAAAWLIRSKADEQGFAEVAGFFRSRKNIDIRMGPRTAKRAGGTVFFQRLGALRAEDGGRMDDCGFKC